MVIYEPIDDRVVLKRLDSSVEVDGILLPEHENQQIIKAEVIAVGPGRMLENGDRGEMQCKVGDIVLVNSFACAPDKLPLDVEGEFMLIPQRDIAAIVRD